MKTINVELVISGKEEHRIFLGYLQKRFSLDELWKDGKIFTYEQHYHGDTTFLKEIGTITPVHEAAKLVYDHINPKKS